MKRVSGAGLVVLVAAVVLASGQRARADARSDLDSRKRDYESLKRDYETRKDEVNKYLESSRALRSLDKSELEKLIAAICKQDSEYDGDDATRVSESLRDKAIDTVRRGWDDAVRAAESVEDRTEKLMNDLKSLRDGVKSISDEESVRSDRSALLDQIGRLIDESSRLYEKLMQDYKSLSNVKEGVMKGANNPTIRARMEYGKTKHKEMQSSFKCEEKEVVLSSGRPDCVLFNQDDCVVLEFKPDTLTKADAASQAEKYISDVQRKFKGDGRAAKCKKNSDGDPMFRPAGETYPACRL